MPASRTRSTWESSDEEQDPDENMGWIGGDVYEVERILARRMEVTSMQVLNTTLEPKKTLTGFPFIKIARSFSVLVLLTCRRQLSSAQSYAFYL